MPKRTWRKLSAGRGATGRRFYRWAVVDLVKVAPGHHRYPDRRNRTTGELACSCCRGRPDWMSTRSAAALPGLLGRGHEPAVTGDKGQ
ncbi:hypothetical protein ACSHXN_36855 [Streptomyces sp. HUAS TT11]|uniref:hypothetical protein n=1 Tax=Streptomyces sp. HUAS TT11 TaxID=3447508 RepID=UPI003F655C8E